MLKIFRKIRQKFLQQNRISSYLAYAVGEIILVVIGILIALSINNWNETRKQQEEERKYLYALRTDFETAKQSFSVILGAVEEQLDHNEQFITIIAGTEKNISTDSLVGMLRKSFIDVPFGVQVTSYTDLLNSGKLGILQSEELRRALTQFEVTNALANSYAEKAAQQWANQVTEFFIQRLNVSKIYGVESDVQWNSPGIPLSTGYDKTPIIHRFESDEEALWGRELANRIVIKNVLLEDASVSANDVLQLIGQIESLIDQSLEEFDK